MLASTKPKITSFSIINMPYNVRFDTALILPKDSKWRRKRDGNRRLDMNDCSTLTLWFAMGESDCNIDISAVVA